VKDLYTDCVITFVSCCFIVFLQFTSLPLGGVGGDFILLGELEGALSLEVRAAMDGESFGWGCIEHLLGREGHIEAVEHLAVGCGAVIYLNLHFVIHLLLHSRTWVGNICEDERAVVARGGRIPLRTSNTIVGIPYRKLTGIITISGGGT